MRGDHTSQEYQVTFFSNSLGNSTEKDGVRSETEPSEPEAGDREDIEFGLD